MRCHPALLPLAAVMFATAGCASTPPTFTVFEPQKGLYYIGTKSAQDRAELIRAWHQKAAEICGGRDRYVIVSQSATTSSNLSGKASTGFSTSDRSRAEGYVRCRAETVPATTPPASVPARQGSEIDAGASSTPPSERAGGQCRVSADCSEGRLCDRRGRCVKVGSK